MEIKNLIGVSLADLTHCFNEAFANYFVEIHATEDYLRGRWKAARVRYDLSCGVFEDGRPIAFIIHGVGERNGLLTAHNIGTGVVPAARGQGLVGQMYKMMLPALKAAGVNYCSLEVIVENVRAIRAYESAGLQKTKVLPCFRGIPTIQKESRERVVVRATSQPDWDLYETFGEVLPSWDNDRSAVQLSGKTYTIFELLLEKQVIGYAVMNPANGYIPQFGVDKRFRRKGYGRMLFSELHERTPALRVINVDEGAEAALQFLKSIGLDQYLCQYEMGMLI